MLRQFLWKVANFQTHSLYGFCTMYERSTGLGRAVLPHPHPPRKGLIRAWWLVVSWNMDHCVKMKMRTRNNSVFGHFVQIRNYFWSAFSCIRTEHGDLQKCPNTELFLNYSVNLRIQSEYRKIRTRNNSVFGHFSCNGWNENLCLKCHNWVELRHFTQWIHSDRLNTKTSSKGIFQFRYIYF